MKCMAAVAVLLSSLSLPVTAQEPSYEARLLLYCSAREQATSEKELAEAIAKVKSRAHRLLAAEGLSDELIELLAITSVEQVLHEIRSNEPPYYSPEQCVDVSIRQ